MKNLRYLPLLLMLSAGHTSEVYFSPEGGIRDAIIKRINLSKSTIDVAVYSFTAGEIAQALADAHKRGVVIRVIRDGKQSQDKHDENAFLIQNGILIKKRMDSGRGIMHHKFAVFDGKETCTGSYNFSENAERYSNENWLCTDETKVIKAYQGEFEMLWKRLN